MRPELASGALPIECGPGRIRAGAPLDGSGIAFEFIRYLLDASRKDARASRPVIDFLDHFVGDSRNCFL